jgi:hypothetical protein
MKKFVMPKLVLNKGEGIEVKYVDLCNGSRIIREINQAENREDWTFISAALSNIDYEIDLAGSSEGTFWEENKSEIYTVNLKSFYTVNFSLKRGSTVKFNIRVIGESPLPM